MLSQPSVDLEKLEQAKSEIEERVLKVSKDLNLVLVNEKTLAYKVKLFQTKCKDLETQLEESSQISSTEIRALKREIQFTQEKNDNLTSSYDELKKEYEELLKKNQTDISSISKELNDKFAKA